MRRLLGALAVFVVVGAACTAGGGNNEAATVNPSGSHQPVTLNVWSFYTGRELRDYNKVLQGFHQLYPWITVTHTGAKSDQDFIRAISAGTAPDVAISAGPDFVAKFCSTGAFQDLSPDLAAAKIDVSSVVPKAALQYTSYQGDQCTLPVLSDAYGLYYNTSMFKKAGITSPPKTFSELEMDAKKLTAFNPDGSIKVAGFVPLNSFYESYSLYYGAYTGGNWYSSNGKSAFASDPSWAKLLEWEQSFIRNVYGPNGYTLLRQFIADLGGANSEWSSSQGFEAGRLAMALDGEWRVAFIAADHANVKYATAPFPVADDQSQLYGAGQIGGDILGIPKDAPHPAEAWLLVDYLALNTHAEEQLAEMLDNVPTTFASLKDPKLASDPHFATFLKIFSNPNSKFKQLTTIGDADETAWSDFLDKWEAGQAPNLQAGLQNVASQIDSQRQLG